MPFADEEDIAELKASFDPVRDGLVQKLHKASRPCQYDKERVVVFSKGARSRFDKWSVEITKQAYYSDQSEIMLPTVSRLTVSIAKVSGALAMYNGRLVVEEEDVLHALAQAELWYQDMLRMSGEIASSDYEKKLDDIEAFIQSGSGGKRSDAAIRRKFARYRASEYDDFVNSLRKQGRVRYNPQDRKILEAF